MKAVWFGTRAHARWVRMFSPGIGYQAAGASERTGYSNGGLGMRESTNSHMEYTLSWPNMNRERIAQITDFANGLYGDGPIYWVDPVAADRNLFNLGWSAPGHATMDAVPLAGTVRPVAVPNLDQSHGYPTMMAQYTLDSSTPTRSFYVPIPPGHTAWLGAHGIPSPAGLIAQQTVRGIPVGAPASVPVTGVADRDRFTHSFVGGEQSGLEVRLDTSAGLVTLAGLMLQILPTGKTPKRGDFIAGEGHSGCAFEGKPSKTPYRLVDGRESVGLSAKLNEIGDWV